MAGDRPGARGCLAVVMLVLLVFSGLAHAFGAGQHAGPPAEDHPAGLHAAEPESAMTADAYVCCAESGDSHESTTGHAECGSGDGCPLCVPAGLVTTTLQGDSGTPEPATPVVQVVSPAYILYRPPSAPVPS